ncbi:MAG: gamma carbonic anhydrase family protein [Acidobacteria bacterium]|nr:gamma carbonic anhydrase family protein [Acidobacteriota bacterium]
MWFGVVLRGDSGRIVIGQRSNVQDNAVIHVSRSSPTVVGEDVTIGHGALLEGCQVGDGAVVGMGAIVLHEVEIGEQAMIAAGSVLTPGTKVPARTLAAGSPAQVKKELSGAALRAVEGSATAYCELKDRYLGGATGP